jgi:ribose-phosphate pyrophosphokinase
VSETINPDEVRVFSGSSNLPLAAEIANSLSVPLDPTRISRFSNDCLYIQLGASVRSRKVFIVQSLTSPVNDHLMELLMMLDIARSASAQEVHAIIPYFSFSRSDKKDAPRISITGRLVADLLQTAGATHVMTMMLHSPQVHGFFSVPTDPLSSRPVIESHFQQRDLAGTIVVAADMGHAQSAARFAKNLSLPDEIATGGTIVELVGLLVAEGIEEIWVACTHGVFARDGLAKLAAVPQITEIVTTDTVHIPPAKRHPKLQVLSVARIFGEAIRRNYLHRSISELFVYGESAGES